MKFYCVRDRKANVCNRPFAERDHVMAIRGFEQLVQNPETPLSKWPADFELLHLGEFDEATAKFSNLEMPLVLADGMQFTRPVSQ